MQLDSRQPMISSFIILQDQFDLLNWAFIDFLEESQKDFHHIFDYLLVVDDGDDHVLQFLPVPPEFPTNWALVFLLFHNICLGAAGTERMLSKNKLVT